LDQYLVEVGLHEDIGTKRNAGHCTDSDVMFLENPLEDTPLKLNVKRS
jgi:hypothetical protein